MINEAQEIEEAENAPMSDSEIVSVMSQEISQGIGGRGNEARTEVSIALDYYLGRLPGMSARKARDVNSSRYISTDVMDAVEATMAEIMPMFADSQLALFNPSGEQDVEQAELESSLVNYLFINEYNGYVILQELVKDALLNRNCTVKVFWDERTVVEYETYNNVPGMAIQQILQPIAPNQTVDIVEQYVDGEAPVQPQNENHAIMQATGLAPAVEETFSIKIRRSTIVGRPIVESLAPEHVIISNDQRTPLTTDVRFIAHRKLETVSSLIAQGFDPELVNQLPDYNDLVEDESREITYVSGYTSADDSTRTVQVHECYVLLDVDGDGIAERRKILIGGLNTLLSNDEWTGVPIVGGCSTMIPHAYEGVSMYDRMKSIQDAKTPLIRAIIDGTLLASNPRIGIVTGEVNQDDIITSVTGGIVRADSPGSIFQLPNPEVPNSSYHMLELMDSFRREKGGGAISNANMAQNVAGDSAHAVERTMSAMELSNALLAKTIAETAVRGLFTQLHKVIRENNQTEITAKIGGKWVSSYPAQWQNRANVTIQVGSSQGERRRRAAVMDKIIQSQGMLAQTGSVLFSEEKLFDALSDGAKLDGVPNPDRYYVDVSSPEGAQIKQQKEQKDAEAKQKAEQIEMKLIEAQQMLGQAELIKSQADMQANQVKMQNENLKSEIQALKEVSNAKQKSAELQYDYDKLAVDTETEREKIKSSHALKLTEMELDAAKDLSKQYDNSVETIEDDD